MYSVAGGGPEPSLLASSSFADASRAACVIRRVSAAVRIAAFVAARNTALLIAPPVSAW